MQPLQPGQQISRRNFNASMEQSRRQSNMRGGRGTHFSNTPSGVQLDSPDDWIWAQLTAAPGGSGQGYAWSEVMDDGAGGQVVDPDGLTGTVTSYQAFPWNGIPVPLIGLDGQPTVVQLWFSPNSETMVFFYGGATGLTRIRIVGLPVKAPTTNWWYYPGVQLKTFTPTALWVDTSTTAFATIDTACLNGLTPGGAIGFNCWVVFWDTLIDVAGIDGTWSPWAVPTGSVFDPTTALSTLSGCAASPGDTYAAPVFDAVSKAAGVASQCITDSTGADTTLNLR